MNYIKFTLIFFSSLWLIGAVSIGLDKLQYFHRRGMERVRRLESEAGRE
jgi:hypothetical protein